MQCLWLFLVKSTMFILYHNKFYKSNFKKIGQIEISKLRQFKIFIKECTIMNKNMAYKCLGMTANGCHLQKRQILSWMLIFKVPRFIYLVSIAIFEKRVLVFQTPLNTIHILDSMLNYNQNKLEIVFILRFIEVLQLTGF